MIMKLHFVYSSSLFPSCFTHYDPIEDTETMDPTGTQKESTCFTHYDPIEDTETTWPASQANNLIVLHPLRSDWGYWNDPLCVLWSWCPLKLHPLRSDWGYWNSMYIGRGFPRSSLHPLRSDWGYWNTVTTIGSIGNGSASPTTIRLRILKRENLQCDSIGW